MRLDAKSGLRGVLVNGDTGQPIRFARWADLDTGAYEAFAVGPDGQMAWPPRVVRGQARLTFIPAASAKPSACSATPPLSPTKAIRVLALPDRECEERGCHRLADWRVGHEQLVEPEIGPDGKAYERGVITAVHYYCSWHYRAPLSTSQRGVESEVPVRVRPQ